MHLATKYNIEQKYSSYIIKTSFLCNFFALIYKFINLTMFFFKYMFFNELKIFRDNQIKFGSFLFY